MKTVIPILFVLILFSCAKKVVDTTPTPIPPVVLANPSVRGYTATAATSAIQLKTNAILIGKELNDKLVEKTGTTITYLTTTESNTIAPGDVLYSKPTDKAPDGYALMVVKKTVQGDKIVFDTRQATMSEVFVKLKETQSYTPNFLKEAPIFYDPADPANRGGRTAAGGLPLDPKRIKGFQFTEKNFTMEYILFDGDLNFETTNDQFILGLSLDHTLTNTTLDYDGNFKLTGEHKYSFTPSLTYTYTVDKISTDFLTKTVSNFKKDFVGKKILICSVPVPSNPAASLLAKPFFDLYLTFELEGAGKFKVYYSYENFGYSFNYNSGKKEENSFTALTTGQNTFGAEVSFEGKAKLALGAGFFIKFPAFETKPGEPSYVALASEVGIGATFNFTGGIYKDKDGLSCKSLIIKPELTWDSYLEAKLGILEKPAVEQKYLIYSKTPRQLADRKWDVCEAADVPTGPFDIKTGLVAYYSFNGHSKDSTANAFHAVPLNGAVLTTDRNGRTNSAYAFTGSQKSALKITTSKSTTISYADTTHVLNQLKDKITLSAWVYLNRG